ncbi:hypothetical protein HMPREF9018_1673 [Prevotella amnii CRIS 21A-A]|uniref:Uncharacterized protein n=1 Tax=Prevotella amnii CRIS 21A-A TaxID=679191 RepID=E1GUK8_9BACT|nr:hypothetical protein HMPREF9018_1673 [Prevotella amnii CRIS 21A-A]
MFKYHYYKVYDYNLFFLMEKISLKTNSLSEIICIFAIRVVEFAVIFFRYYAK